MTNVFVVGCPRSGTTWMQLLLAQNDRVATAPETQIFAYYLNNLKRQWDHEYSRPDDGQGRAGLSLLLSPEEFDDLCRDAAQRVLDGIAARKPGATLIVEKSPRHALTADWIARLFPDAKFVNLVRDPRDVAVSLKDAGRTWGRSWAPQNVIDGARLWDRHVQAVEPLVAEGRCRNVYYRDLIADTGRELQRVYEWIGNPVSAEEADSAAEACRLDRLRKMKPGEDMPMPAQNAPAGFFRRGRAGAWNEELSDGELRSIEYICGETMDRLGFPRSTGAARASTRWRVRAHDVLQRVRESIDWQLQRLLRHV